MLGVGCSVLVALEGGYWLADLRDYSSTSREPQREDHRRGEHARQDVMLTGLVLALTLPRSGNAPLFALSLLHN